MRRLEVDGLPAVLAPVSGPTHAGLVFRVGTADEPLSRRGITRLVERVVTSGRGGSIGPEHTYFHVQGSVAEITGYLSRVCEALRDPPVRRLAAARERAGRAERDPLPLWRHGAVGFGAASYPEWALPGLTESDLREWIARYFTRENAALWVAGEEVPQGLVLDLPSGERRPAPQAATMLPVTPAFFAGETPGVVAWDSVVRRGPRAAVFANVLERRMLDELGGTGQARTEYVIRCDGTARIAAVAQVPADRQEAALGALVDVLAAVRAGRLGPDEVAAVVKLTCTGLRDSESRGARLPGQAFSLLAGREVQSLEEALAEVRAVTVADVAVVAAEAYDAGLLMTPPGSSAGWAGYAAAPAMSQAVLKGRTHRGRGNRTIRLISGDEGVSVTGPDTVASVRWDSCVAMLVWPDGARHLIGEDAVVVRIEPSVFRGADAVVRQADERVPQHLRIAMPPRDRDRIPQPEPAPRTGVARLCATLAVSSMFALFFVAGAVWALTRLVTGLGDPREGALVLAGSVAFAIFCGRSCWIASRDLRSLRKGPRHS